MAGKVFLVGAGPGDPKLITLRGLECIAQADVLIYDRLATNLLFEHAKPGVEYIYVGKAEGKHSVKQSDINQILVDKAKEGNIVTRLKGGDPLIFGRGGEEALTLFENGIDFEFVPGVSSGNAVPAYAGIPVTHRGMTSTVAYVTGHEDPSKPNTDIDWKSLVGIGTIIFYMGMRNLPKIVEQLTANGRSDQTPVAVIRWGTTPQQQTVIGTLSDIVQRVTEVELKAPCIIIVGEVVSLREKLCWYEKKPLFGKRILVTRAKEQAGAFSDLLSDLGGQVIEIPTIKIADPDSFDGVDRALKRLESGPGYDWIIFTSANGVEYFIKRMKDLEKDIRILAGSKIAVIGPATARAVKRLLVNIEIMPKEFVAEGLIDEFDREGVEGKSILIPRAKVARNILPDTLKQMGAEVDVAEAYQTVLDNDAALRIKELLVKGAIDIATFTSPSTIDNFAKLVGPDLHQLIDGLAIAVIGPVTAEAVKKLGLNVDIIAGEYTVPGLVEAIVEHAGAEAPANI
ncbi:MAG: uroporphyrinogen-III C-methyltransferase [Candidatus Aquicultor sp.]|nr:uroporphyrinogen-III C-methyltransferase [Candidatus Aquicultor sp.]